MTNHTSHHSLQQFQWMCRRGMLELDLVLMKLIDCYYHCWNDQQKQDVYDFLQQDDPTLFNLLITKKTQCEPRFDWIINNIDSK